MAGRIQGITVTTVWNGIKNTITTITVGYLDMETMNIVTTQMYIDGYQVKLVSDTSYGSLWEVSFTLKEF